ncbi:MAG TPA: hypothetical protein VFD49_20255 [Candidatus Dormibacteraeota bacterium]|nr:hypothetical protein [Candidatus Dormibacteraeota bacterium]
MAAYSARRSLPRSSLVSSLSHGGRGGESWLAIALLDEAERAAGADAQHRTWLLARRAEEHAATHHGVGRARAELSCKRDLAAAERSLATNHGETRCLPGPRSALDLAGFRWPGVAARGAGDVQHQTDWSRMRSTGRLRVGGDASAFR